MLYLSDDKYEEEWLDGKIYEE